MFHKRSSLKESVYKTKIISPRIYYFIYFLAAGLCLLFLVFVFLFLPSAKVVLKVTSEPLIVDFEIKLDTKIKNILFNLDSIPARFTDLNNRSGNQEEKIIPDLINQNSGQAIVFSQNDLLEIIDYKIKQLIGPDKKAVELGKKNFTIQVKNSDFNTGQALIDISIKTRTAVNYNLIEIKQRVAYQEIFKAEEYLGGLSGVRNVRIKKFPPILRRMPYFPQRINIALDIF